MLDLTQLAQQMQGISQHLTQEAAATRLRLERSQTLLDKAYRQQDELVALQEQWRDRITFTAATQSNRSTCELASPLPPMLTPSSPPMAPKLRPATTKSPIAT